MSILWFFIMICDINISKGDDMLNHHIDLVFEKMIDEINYLKIASVVRTKFVDLNDGYKRKLS